MSIERSRIALLTGVAALVLSNGFWSTARSQTLQAVTVYKSPT